MFMNPGQGQFSGSTLHHGSSRQLLTKNGGITTNNNQSSEEPGQFAMAGNQGTPVTDNLVEGLKRDIKIYVEKCSMIVISSKKSAEESKARARARDEQLIDLEW